MPFCLNVVYEAESYFVWHNNRIVVLLTYFIGVEFRVCFIWQQVHYNPNWPVTYWNHGMYLLFCFLPILSIKNWLVDVLVSLGRELPYYLTFCPFNPVQMKFVIWCNEILQLSVGLDTELCRGFGVDVAILRFGSRGEALWMEHRQNSCNICRLKYFWYFNLLHFLVRRFS